MYTLENKLKLEDVVSEVNIAARIDVDELKKIGAILLEAFNADWNSSAGRMEKIAEAEKLAMMITEKKTFPWADAANIKMPIIQLASLQFHSRAFPELVSAPDLVRCVERIPSEDGEVKARAKRLSEHMSFQITEKMEGWISDQDRLLLTLPIAGCAFKKVFFDTNRNVSESVLIRPSQFVVSYHTRNIRSAGRASHYYPIDTNTVISRIRQGVFLDNEEVPYDSEQYIKSVQANTHRTPEDDVRDEKQGIEPNTFDNTPMAVEMHCWLDLDGDNYCEPYIVTFDMFTGWVWRIRARFADIDIIWADPDKPFKSPVVHIEPETHFVKYGFIPSPDGGFYDLGYYDLLGPVNETINTIINQMIDNNTMSMTKGGFLGKGARVRGGDYRFKPFEWKRLDSIAARLDEVIFPLPVGDVSPMTLELLGMLVEYCERVAGSTESMTGITPGQNTPAETSRNVMEQGLKVYSAIYLRVYLAQAEEFKLIYRQNALYLRTGGEPFIETTDYDLEDFTVSPASDPAVASDALRIQQAMGLINGLQMGVPFDGVALGELLATALKVREPMSLFPKEAPPPQPDPTKLEVAKIAAQQREQDSQRKHEREMFKLMQIEVPILQAEIAQLEAVAKERNANAVYKTVEAQVALDGSKIAEASTLLEAKRTRLDTLLQLLELIQSNTEKQNEEDTDSESSNRSDGGDVRGMVGAAADATLGSQSPIAAGLRQASIERGGLADVRNPTARNDGVDREP